MLLISHSDSNNHQSSDHTFDPMFYERQQNFGFPITTTNDGGFVLQKPAKVKNSGIDGLNKLNADIKAGKVQLDDNAFGDNHIAAAARRQETDDYSGADGAGFELDDDERKTSNEGVKDSLDMVGGDAHHNKKAP